MNDHMVRRAGLTVLLLVLGATVGAIGRRLASTRNDRVGITPIPIP